MYFNKELKSNLETVNYIFYHDDIFTTAAGRDDRVASDNQTKSEIYFPPNKKQPSFTQSRQILLRQESVFVNDSFCDHFTLSLNNRNETTAASGDSAKTFAPPGSGQHSQLPSRVRREVRPRLHYLAATRDLHRPLLIQNIRTSCDHLQREIPFRLQQTEKESNCCADTSGFISPGT